MAVRVVGVGVAAALAGVAALGAGALLELLVEDAVDPVQRLGDEGSLARVRILLAFLEQQFLEFAGGILLNFVEFTFN